MPGCGCTICNRAPAKPKPPKVNRGVRTPAQIEAAKRTLEKLRAEGRCGNPVDYTKDPCRRCGAYPLSMQNKTGYCKECSRRHVRLYKRAPWKDKRKTFKDRVTRIRESGTHLSPTCEEGAHGASSGIAGGA